MKTDGPRIIVAVLLILVVSIVNGISGVGYTIGGEFETSLQAAAGKDDPRWQERREDGKTVQAPRDAIAAISLLLETKYGRFGIFLQLLALLQFVAGLLLLVRKNHGRGVLSFLAAVAAAGIMAEVVGSVLTSALGRTNIIGIIASLGLLGVVMMQRKTAGEAQPGATEN